MDIIADILGIVVRFIYDITANNYALTIVLFTILAKVMLFPLNLKQAKSTREMQKIKPKYDEILKKHKNDKVKQSEELTKLYSEHKINPLGGCLPLLIQLPLILAIFYIVKQPLTYVVQMPQEEIKIYSQEILQIEDVTEAQMDELEIRIANEHNILDMNVLGLNLGDVPANAFSSDENTKSGYESLIIPILAALTAYIQIKMSQKTMVMTEEQKEMQKSLNYTMPILSAVISYTTPLALGVYWLVGNIYAIGQQAVIRYIVKKEDEKEESNIKFLSK